MTRCRACRRPLTNPVSIREGFTEKRIALEIGEESLAAIGKPLITKALAGG